MRTSAFAAPLCLTLAVLAAPQALAAPLLISVDLQSSFGTEGAAFSGPEAGATAANAAFAAASVWNVYGTTGNVVNFNGNGALTLKDRAGTDTGAKFSITGTTNAFGNDLLSTNTLLRDYFFWGTASTSTAISWQITGLAASTSYAFYTYGSFSNARTPRGFLMRADTDGDGDLGDETAVTVSSTELATGILLTLTTDANGVLRGTNESRIVNGFREEANWAGFQLVELAPSRVPEPGSAALALLAFGALGAVARRRKP